MMGGSAGSGGHAGSGGILALHVASKSVGAGCTST